jgi:hypothetical protein
MSFIEAAAQAAAAESTAAPAVAAKKVLKSHSFANAYMPKPDGKRGKLGFLSFSLSSADELELGKYIHEGIIGRLADPEKGITAIEPNPNFAQEFLSAHIQWDFQLAEGKAKVGYILPTR